MAKLLITREQLIKYTRLGANVDMDKVVPFIITAEDIQLQSQLGTRLFTKLKTLIDDGTIGDVGNEDYKYIYDTYVVKMLAFFTMSDFALAHPYQFNNTGVTRPQQEFGLLPEIEEVNKLSQNLEDKAIAYTSMFVRYMCYNSSKFPEWTSNTNADISPLHGKNRSTWWLG